MAVWFTVLTVVWLGLSFVADTRTDTLICLAVSAVFAVAQSIIIKLEEMK